MLRRLKAALGFNEYTPEFYAKQQERSRSSAHAILPLVLRVVPAQNAIDVGCGIGTWTAELISLGVKAEGIDGQYVLQNELHIPRNQFRPVDLDRLPSPTDIGRYDLALCMEVAEHLKPENGPAFVRFLTELAPNILFGAAIPGQGGRGHLNERWQSYWVSLFGDMGFHCRDIVRSAVWYNEAVEPWYAQNTFLFTKTPQLDLPESTLPLDLVHPRTFTMKRRKTRKEKREIRLKKPIPPDYHIG